MYHGYSGKAAMDCDELKSSVLNWFGSEIECQPIGDNRFVATFPIMRVNGDAIEIGISLGNDGRWKLSDLGETRATFFLDDLDFHQQYIRAEELNQIAAAHRLTHQGEEISVDISVDELPDGIFDFLHALQSMSALQFTAKPREIHRDFPSIVAKFLAEQKAIFEVPPDYVEGLCGRWKFDFVLNQRDETLVRTISTQSKTSVVKLAEQATFEIGDVRKLREIGAVVIGDDHGKERESVWRTGVVRIFTEYGIPFYAFEGDQDGLIDLAAKHTALGT